NKYLNPDNPYDPINDTLAWMGGRVVIGVAVTGMQYTTVTGNYVSALTPVDDTSRFPTTPPGYTTPPRYVILPHAQAAYDPRSTAGSSIVQPGLQALALQAEHGYGIVPPYPDLPPIRPTATAATYDNAGGFRLYNANVSGQPPSVPLFR